MEINYEIVLGIISGLGVLATKIGFDKWLSKKNTEDKLLDLYIKLADSQKELAMNLTNLANEIKAISNTFRKINVDSKDTANHIVLRFGESLCKDFIKEMTDIYMINHLSDEVTPSKIKNTCENLIKNFYNELYMIDGMKDIMHPVNEILIEINNSKFYDRIYSIMIRTKNNNIDISNFKNELANNFFIMINQCVNLCL